MRIKADASKRDIVIVTGSSGYIGKAIIKRLAANYAIVGFDRDSPPHPPTEAECVCVDLTSDERVDAAFKRVRYAYGDHIASVVHLAAYYSFSGEPSPQYEEVTVQGTRRLLRELQKFQVGQFIFSSTMLVHAPVQPGQKINEETPLEPKWDYPKSKVRSEEFIHAEQGEIPAVILRIAGVYDDRCHSVPLAHQIQRIYEADITGHYFPGELTHGQSFVHLEDLVNVMSLSVERRAQLPKEITILIGEPEVVSYGELQHQFGCLIHGREWPTRNIPKALAKASAWIQDAAPLVPDPFIKPWMIELADDHYDLDITRARQALGWEPHHSLRETLPKMISALKADPEKWYRENKLGKPPQKLTDPGSSHIEPGGTCS